LNGAGRLAVAHDIRVVQRNNRYSVGEMLRAVLYPMILGLARIETTHLLSQNGVYQYLTGLQSYPNPTTLRPVSSGRTVVIFNIGGNKYRLITAIHYNTRKVFVLRFLTHAEYDLQSWKEGL
jgi:hypothetical protein